LDLVAAGLTGEYVVTKPEECCLAFKRRLAILDAPIDDIALQGSLERWWYMLYGVAGGAYGHADPETPAVGVVTPLKLVVIEPGSIEPVPEVIDAAAATDVAAALKQLTEL
jgi:hypothetical protein